jgi:hypothetical protein
MATIERCTAPAAAFFNIKDSRRLTVCKNRPTEYTVYSVGKMLNAKTATGAIGTNLVQAAFLSLDAAIWDLISGERRDDAVPPISGGDSHVHLSEFQMRNICAHSSSFEGELS